MNGKKCMQNTLAPRNRQIQQLRDRLRQFFQKETAVLFCYLFGSVASGTTTPKSDIDLAVYLDPDKSKDLFKSRLELITKTSTLLKKDIDIIVLNTAPPFLKHVVFREGILLFDRNPSQRIDFELKATNEYFDYKPILELYRQRLLAS